MASKVPLWWIEDAEAKEVLRAARFERAADPSWFAAARAAVTAWLSEIRVSLLPPLAGWLMPQAQPALVRQTTGRVARLPAHQPRYSCEW